MVRLTAFVITIFGASMLAACSPAGAGPEAANSNAAAPQAATEEQAPADVGTHPTSGLPVIEVLIESASGTHRFKSELAVTPEAQARGLMFRTELADDEAMLFPSDPPAPRSFWMRNTPISLDIIYVGVDDKILNIAENTEPYSLESLPSAGIASSVFEIRGGLSQELGIAAGDRLTYSLPE
ncbi:MAG: DUF192 domain-containing protein [Erythrobacter sp.]